MPVNEVAAAKNSNGFVYLKAKPMTKNIDSDYPTLNDCINHLKSIGIDRKIYVGVGVRDAEDIRMAKESGSDGVFLGAQF
jgi:tryptophan synthase alpha chain